MRRGGRAGVTLLEVLVTIFIMAIGMLSLLVLFPLGALEMARALKDDRCASACALANGIAIAQSIRNDPLVVWDGAGGTVTNAYLNPFGTALIIGSPGPSYAVLVDPFGYLVDSPSTTNERVGALTVGGTQITPGIRRRSCSLVNYTGRNPVPTAPAWYSALTTPECQRWCTLQDDIYFTPEAVPDTSSGSVQRAGRYTWAWLVRQLSLDTTVPPSPANIEMDVIVYQDRDTSTGTGDTTTYQVVSGTGLAGTNTVTIDYSPQGTAPPMKVGRWIMDVTQWNVAPYGTGAGTNDGPVPGYMYRVVNYTDDPTTKHMELELEKGLYSPVPAAAIVIMQGVAEVFNRSTPQ
jgi:prepilin-type N-terminal cleavage/methylation domain-containing protein